MEWNPARFERGQLVAASKSSLTALTLGAIGVVYGDIGTSVLYAVKEVFGSGHVPFTPDNVYGILSIFFWTLTVIISLKYVTLVLRADNNGEGGLVAMLALASQSVKDKPELRRVLLVVGIFGACLFYGDGVITPAISVLSAVEGLEVVSPTFKSAVIPLTLVILFGLFAVQKAWYGRHWQVLWSDHGRLVRHDCGPGCGPYCRSPHHSLGHEPSSRAGLHVAQPGHHLHHPRRCGALRHRWRSLVRRHGSLRQRSRFDWPGFQWSCPA